MADTLPKEVLQKKGRDFVNAVFSLLETCIIHAENNDALKRPSATFIEKLKDLSTIGNDEKVTIEHLEQVTTVYGIRIFHHFSIANSLPEVEGAFLNSGVEAISFGKSMTEAEAVLFFSEWANHTRNFRIAKHLQTTVEKVKLKLVNPDQLNYRYQIRQKLRNLNYILQTYFLLRQHAEDFFRAVSVNRIVPQSKLRRSLVTMCEIAHYEPYTVLGLSLIIDDRKDTTGLSLAVNQALRTSLLCLIFAKELGLDTQTQVDIAHLGLIYNVGVVGERSVEILKNDQLTPDEYQKVINSQAAGVLKLLRSQSLTRSVLERLLTIYEYAHGGSGSAALTLDCRILRLVSRYVALTSDRPFRDAYTPPEALRILGQKALNREESDLDPMLYYIFVRFIGPHPVGSLYSLSDGRQSVLLRPSGDKIGLPVVRIRTDSADEVVNEMDLGKEADLRLNQCLDPRAEGVNVASYFFRR